MTGERGRPRTPLRDRFLAKVVKGENCWEWKGSKNSNGYGRIKDAGDINRYAHRVAWQLAFGEAPEGMVVSHRCDNPACVNPEHLCLTSQAANLLDAEDKGRLDRKAPRLGNNTSIDHSRDI